MAITLQAVTLDSSCGDSDARLVLRDGLLIAVLSRLGDLHEDLAGHWYVEAAFGDGPMVAGHTFDALPQVETFLSGDSDG